MWGINNSQIPELSQRTFMAAEPRSQPLKLPMTAMYRAEGAQTAKYVPMTPLCSTTCEPNFSYSR